MIRSLEPLRVAALGLLLTAQAAAAPLPDEKADEPAEKPDFPKHGEVLKGFEKVVSTADGEPSLYGLYIRKKDGQMYAELPKGYARQKHIIALTVPTGEIFAGLQSQDLLVYWKRFDKRMALMTPDVSVRTTGNDAAKDAYKRHFVDRVLIDVPIACIGPGGQPVIDVDELFVGKADTFYGGSARSANTKLATIAKAKAFPQNIEVAFTAPVSNGEMKTFHYSVSVLPEKTGYEPRVADDRLGYFTTYFRDFSKVRDDEVWTRYINRWHLEKADPSLSVSPAKEPIVYYIEHTVPVKYRRYVKQGALYWNEAFEDIGISDAIVIHYQDKTTGAHMDKDPEDVRYNFIRWLTNDIGTAIGPSRAHPLTGQILDADVILTDGWIRHFWYQANEYLPKVAMESMTPEAIAWFDAHPKWDPRVRMLPPAQQQRLVVERMQQVARGEVSRFDEYALSGDDALAGLAETIDPDTALCMAAEGKSRDMALLGLTWATLMAPDACEACSEGDLCEACREKTGCEVCKSGELCEKCRAAAAKKEDEEPTIDGIPESFVGPMLADLVAHEVGHTLGLRHNFKASSLYTLSEINSETIKDDEPFAGSVMDYLPVNINMDDGVVQGDWAMIGIGPYDHWAIEYGYGFEDPEEVASRVAEPLLAYATDYDTTGPDPLARRYDFAKDPLAYAESRMRLSRKQRDKILDEFVDEGESWGKARRGYQITLGTQTSVVNMMANWVGGTYVHKDHKGDPNARPPAVVVPAETQREALAFVIDNTFRDEAFGLSPELLQHMSLEKWSDEGGMWTLYEDATWPLHDTIAGIQASTLSMLMNPSTLRRVFDNESMVPADEDALTLPELMKRLTDSIWTEVASTPRGTYTNRKPLISSLRRNLQQEHLGRLVDLLMEEGYGAANKPIRTLAAQELRRIGEDMHDAVEAGGLDDYTAAHLAACQARIEKALDAEYILNAGDMGGSFGGFTIFFGEPAGR